MVVFMGKGSHSQLRCLESTSLSRKNSATCSLFAETFPIVFLRLYIAWFQVNFTAGSKAFSAQWLKNSISICWKTFFLSSFTFCSWYVFHRYKPRLDSDCLRTRSGMQNAWVRCRRCFFSEAVFCLNQGLIPDLQSISISPIIQYPCES